MLGMTSIREFTKVVCREPAVTRVARHDAKIIGKKTLFANPFRYNRSKVGGFVDSANVTGTANLSVGVDGNTCRI
jgi:hypothetical protein